jgi:Dual specificity phosphatase, catalytic domain
VIHGTTHGGRKFTIDPQTRLEDDLWVGAYARGPFSDDAWQAGPYWQVLDLRPEFPDSIETPVDGPRVEALADQVEEMWARGPVLICCTAGVNRSPLVAAVVLMRRGRTAGEAIDFLRAERGDVVLCNPTFEAWLRGREVAA